MIWSLLLFAAAALVLPASAFAGAGISSCAEGTTVGGLQAVNDLHTTRTDATGRAQTVSVNDDTVLLAIALHNNGASGINWNDLRNVQKTTMKSMTASQTANLDRADVFSALALGIHDTASSLDALACVADFTTAARETTTDTQSVALDQNTVLLAIAVHNAVGSPLVFGDIANMAQNSSTTVTHDQDVSAPTDQTFLALALGGGSAP
ncbi:MAG: hypothetical protein WDA16_05275 [Candidatus Thermoplasmatota archaeon]